MKPAIKSEQDKERQPLLGQKPTTTIVSSENKTRSTANVTDDDDADSAGDDGKSSILITAFCLMLIFQLGNRIFGKLQTFPMHNYPLFLNLLSTAIYVPLSFLYILPMQWFSNSITKEQTEVPKYKFAVMGLLDSIAGIMATFAVNYITNSSIIVLVQQSAIPISMVISSITLNARYTKSQYAGAGIVLIGIAAVLILPTFMASSSASAQSGTSDESSQLLWIGILVLACIPMCLSSVYKEQALGEVDINVIYLNGWVAIFQTIASIPLCFPSAWLIGLSNEEIMPNLVHGFRCWFGVNSIEVATDAMVVDQCDMSPFYVNTYLAFNVVFNVLIIVILKHGSANIMWMASTVIVPLSNVAFSLKFMPNHTTLHWSDWLGLVIIMLGLVIYRFMGAIETLWLSITGKITPEELETQERARKLGRQVEKKQVNFVGINQMEAVETLTDTRISRYQKTNLFRSPAQIRSVYLNRLGIPPSPYVTMIPPRNKKGGNRSGESPAIPMRVVQSKKNQNNMPDV